MTRDEFDSAFAVAARRVGMTAEELRVAARRTTAEAVAAGRISEEVSAETLDRTARTILSVRRREAAA